MKGRSIFALAKASLSANETLSESSSSAVGESNWILASNGSFKAEFKSRLPNPKALANTGVKANKTKYSNRFIVTSYSFEISYAEDQLKTNIHVQYGHQTNLYPE